MGGYSGTFYLTRTLTLRQRQHVKRRRRTPGRSIKLEEEGFGQQGLACLVLIKLQGAVVIWLLSLNGRAH